MMKNFYLHRNGPKGFWLAFDLYAKGENSMISFSLPKTPLLRRYQVDKSNEEYKWQIGWLESVNLSGPKFLLLNSIEVEKLPCPSLM